MPRIDGGGIVIGMGLIAQALEVYVYRTTIAGIDYYLAVRGQSAGGFSVISTSPNAHTSFNAALAYVGGNGGGIVQVDVGTYHIIAPLASTLNNVELQGFGKGTIFDYDRAITTRLITFSGTDCSVRDLKIVVDTHLVPIANQNVITFQGADSEISNVTVDCGNRALDRIFSLEANSCSVVHANIINIEGDCTAIHIQTADDCAVFWNEIRYQGAGTFTASAIRVMTSNHAAISQNTIVATQIYGIMLGYNSTVASYAIVTENIILATQNNGMAVSIDVKAKYCIVADNNIDSQNNTVFSGIEADGEQALIIDNHMYMKDVNAITVGGSNLYTTVSCNQISHGNIVTYGIQGIFTDNHLSNGGIGIDNDGSGSSGKRNYFASNYVEINAVPIHIDSVVCENNVFDFNTVDSAFKITDSGTNTLFPSKSYPFVSGTTLLSTDGSPYGWEVDAAGEFAITFGEMPHRLSVGSIVRMKVVGVGLVAPGAAKFIGLQITGRGALADGSDYATESIDLANIPSSPADSNVNAVLTWVLTSHFSPSVSFSLKVQHEAAAGNNVETDAAFWHLVVEYV